MNVTRDTVEGTTVAMEWNLYNDGEPFDATTMTASAVMKNKVNASISMTGKIEWAVAASSRIRYKPDAADLLASDSPYTLHFKVTDGLGKIAFYPDGEPIIIRVFAQ